MEEIWKDVQFDTRYKVSNKGNVKSFAYGYERLLHPVLNNTGYYFVRIKSKAYMVHRLVALAFIPTEDALLHIDHKDGNKQNNNVDNLKWCTQKENNNNPITRKRISKALLGSKRTEEQKQRMKIAQQNVRSRLGKHHSKETLEKFKHRKPPNTCRIAMMDKEMNVLRSFNSIKEASNICGIAETNICSCCRGKLKTAGGYKWKYVEIHYLKKK